MVRIAVVGYGFMGRAHVANYAKLDDARVVAVVEANPGRLHQMLKGNVEAKEGEASLEGVELFDDLRKILGRGDVDVVDICLPTHLHKWAVLEALDAGHHVICEKPLALTLEDVDEMYDRAAQKGRLLMAAHCIRFWPEYEYLQRAVESGEFGRPLSVLFRRVSPYPGWSGGDDWFSDPKRSGGALFDLHIHDVDFANVLFGRPESVFAQGIEGPRGGTLAVWSQYRYRQGPIVALEGSWEYSIFEMSYHAAFEQAEIRYSSLSDPSLKVYRHGDEEGFAPELPPEDGYVRELRYFVECVRDGKSPDRVAPASVRQSIAMTLAEGRSIRCGQPVSVES